MGSILEVFIKISENEGIKITQLEKKIGASKRVLSRAIANNSDIQSKWLLKLVENYPQYNSEWLLTGKGSMLKSEQNLPAAGLVNDNEVVALLKKNNALLEKNVAILEENKALLQAENERLKAEIQALKPSR